jgi:hypothetical protein
MDSVEKNIGLGPSTNSDNDRTWYTKYFTYYTNYEMNITHTFATKLGMIWRIFAAVIPW